MIHAGLTVQSQDWEFLEDMGIVAPKELPVGGIVGIATMTDCVESSRSKWFQGPFGFVIKDAYPVKYTPLRGMLRFFDVDMKPARLPRPAKASFIRRKGKGGKP